MLYETCMRIYNKHMLIAQDCVICGCIAWQRFLLNNFADFPNVVQVKDQDSIQLLMPRAQN